MSEGGDGVGLDREDLPAAAARELTRLAPRVWAAGILHGRMEFAAGVRRALQAARPDVVAVELPSTIEPIYRRALAHLPAALVLEFEWDDGRPAFLFLSPQDALVEACRYALENDVPLKFVDQDVDGYPAHLDDYPDAYAAGGLGLRRYQELLGRSPSPDHLDQQREATMAHHLYRLSQEYHRVVFVGGCAHIPGLAARLEGTAPPRPLARVKVRRGKVQAVASETLRELLCLGEAPHLVAAYEVARRAGLSAPDRVQQAALLLELATERYQAEGGSPLAPGSLRTFGRYARNLARVDGGFVPDLLQLVTAARGVGDDNFGRCMLELGMTYPFPAPSSLPTRRLTREELEWLRARAVKLRPRQTRPRMRPAQLSLRRRRREAKKGDWRRAWEDGRPGGQCSFPPEDIVIEAAGRRVKDVAQGLLREAAARSAPFSTGMADGVDVRETLRNLHEGRIYVRDDGRHASAVGSVVVVFDDEDDNEANFPWQVTWWGEHDQESDMAFYATDPDAGVVGPGVARAEYGAFLLSYPPGRLADVWADPFYASARSRAERLVMAALEYSVEPYVAYVAARPPKSRWRSMAERFGRRLVYLPLGALARTTRDRIRSFHVLSGSEVRTVAHEYIW